MKRLVKAQTPQAEVEKFNANNFVLENILFKEQLDFVKDPNPFKVAVCSRRSGKTVACAADLIDTAYRNPNSVSLYITLSSISGKRIIWREFKQMVNKFKVGAKLNDIELSITFPNGAVIYVVGAKDASEIEKFRGLALLKVYIDECQSFREYIEDLVDDVIAPALMDHSGSLILIGTPSSVPTGYFWECWNSDNGFSKHHWTFWQNIFIPPKAKKTHQEVFDRELKRRGITDINTPSIQREWFGKWVVDKDSLILHYDELKNDFNELPAVPQWHYILGIDIGFKDADALAVLAFNDTSPTTYLIEEVVATKQGITELVQEINKLQKKYDIHKMVMDMGGLGKKIGEEMIKRYLLPVEAAEKARKMENIKILDDALRTGNFRAKVKSKFAEDTYLVEIDRDKSTPERIVVSTRYHSDIIDAVLYAFKFSPAYSYEPPKPKPQYGSKEWAEAQHDEMFEKTLEGMQAAQSLRNERGGYD